MNHNFKKYIGFWLSQSISQLGSTMTGFALILWAYEQLNSALAVSLMSFCSYVPYIVVSLFAGGFVDSHNKKRIMLFSDSMAAVCSLAVLLLNVFGVLQIWHIYLVNCVIGFMNAFQGPASSVAAGKMVPKERLAQVSGLNSFSGNLTTVLAPMIAAFLFAFGGLKVILILDLGSFLLASVFLLLLIQIPEDKLEKRRYSSAFAGCKEGFSFLIHNRGLWRIVLTMAVMNFFSRLTYENVLSPMILARSGNNSVILGTVNAMMGIGGILGGIIVSAGKLPKDRVKMIYVSAAVSFLLGDLLMGLGRNTVVWSAAGIAASLPIPFITAGQNVILYDKVPDEMQGRIFAVRNAIQFGTVPIGILLGGFLAEYLFEPFMESSHPVAEFLHLFVGTGAGSGMAVMFLCTGICGSIFSILSCRGKEMDALRN